MCKVLIFFSQPYHISVSVRVGKHLRVVAVVAIAVFVAVLLVASYKCRLLNFYALSRVCMCAYLASVCGAGSSAGV